jgi:hypothetical protein
MRLSFDPSQCSAPGGIRVGRRRLAGPALFSLNPAMCATFQFKGKTYNPASEVIGSGEHGIVR